ncbi:hypothetical protein NG54_16680 [Heyndrickxia ginsengihumi]|uniref:Uncharacterized protein n=1 Tax=Heyndrickxia ginsengihumi TaxID=363870 RepID=A0A0A6VCJ8_9BACI|nr:hypothetical protein NG54_16680 [Heyndrickxia ginsengihumi]
MTLSIRPRKVSFLKQKSNLPFFDKKATMLIKMTLEKNDKFYKRFETFLEGKRINSISKKKGRAL